jgi:putative DNA primase/helicase
MMTNPLLKAAERYAARGLHVLPLHSIEAGACSCRYDHCDSPGKHPRTEHGVKDASTDPAVIARWWRMWPRASVGIATGAVSRIIVVDVDDLLALRHLAATKGRLPETATATTGRGVHLYFQHPGGHVPNTSGKIAAHVDTRGDGGYAVAPPSTHYSGAQYRWSSPKGVGPAPCPKWLLDALAAKSDVSIGEGHSGVIANGQRNHVLFRLGCAMRHWGASPGAILAALEADNAEGCEPPLDDSEVRRIAVSAATYTATAHNGQGARDSRLSKLNAATSLRDLVAGKGVL